MSASMYRGMGRDANLTKTTVVLPADMLREIDHIVAERKGINQGFNRSALIELAIRYYLEALNEA